MELLVESLVECWLRGEREHVKYTLWFQQKNNMAYLVLRMYMRLLEVDQDEHETDHVHDEPAKFVQFMKSHLSIHDLVKISKMDVETATKK